MLLLASSRIAAVSQRPVFDLVREQLGPRTGLVNLGASFAINLLTLAAEIGGAALALELATGSIACCGCRHRQCDQGRRRPQEAALERWARANIIAALPGSGAEPTSGNTGRLEPATNPRRRA